MRSHSLAVQASVSPRGAPQAAVVGFVVTDDFEIVFDTVDTTRKVVNLPTGADLGRLKQLYFVRFPDGRDRQRWPGLTYLRVRPRWLRFSDFNQSSPAIVEFTF
jgi:hypothetical protein